MIENTVELNKLLNPPGDAPNVWLFAYGSLIYKVDFPFIERRRASIRDRARRFWQASHDHRGTKVAPGRVVTLIQQPGAVCVGMAFLVSQAVFDHLDYREKNGYLRLRTDISFSDGNSVSGLVYVANEHNSAFLGVASEREIAHQIAHAKGPSGTNRDYLLNLAHALRELETHDEHVFEIERHLMQLNREAK